VSRGQALGSIRRKILDLVIALVLLAIPLAFLHASFRSPEKVSALDRAILAVSSPLQQGASWVIEGVAGIFASYVWLIDVEEENRELRRENERLHELLADATRRARAAAELEGLLELRGQIPAATVTARVVASGMSPYFRVTRIVLDRGEGEVAPGMPVVAPEGIVGRIHRVHGRYADVTLAVDPHSAVDVVVPRTGSRGVLRGLGAENAYSCKISYLLRSEELQPDDLVVTSGLGGLFPRDVPVGRVRRIEKSEYGMYQEVEVAPAVDFSHLSAVLVILAPTPPADPAAKARKAEPAFGLVPGR
jgi:rod shape-determining protein MreC